MSIVQRMTRSSKYSSQEDHEMPEMRTKKKKSSSSKRHLDGRLQNETDVIMRVDPDDHQINEDGFTALRRLLIENLSYLYAMILVMVGVTVYSLDVFSNNYHHGETFTIYLTLIGLAWMVFQAADIRSFINDGPIFSAFPRLKFPGDRRGKDFIRFSCHAPSFYFKFGAAVFALGYLIHEGIILGQIISQGSVRNDCIDVDGAVAHITLTLHTCAQVFFLFQYSNVIINCHKNLAIFGLMHMIASCLCMWTWNIMRETKDVLVYKQKSKTSNATEDGYDLQSFLFRQFEDFSKAETCFQESISSILNKATPYLYPFAIEFNFLMVGVWVLLLLHLGATEKARSTQENRNRFTIAGDKQFQSGGHYRLSIDFQGSYMGFAAGGVMSALSIIAIIIFYSVSSASIFSQALFVNHVSEALAAIVLSVVAILAYRKMGQLDMSTHNPNPLDIFLIYLAVPAFYLYGIMSLIPAIKEQRVAIIIQHISLLIQVSIQTPLIIDGLHRSSSSPEVQERKPGRSLITFLIIGNLDMWLVETFSIKSVDKYDLMTQFYGTVVWTFFSHLTLPLCLFYRFHASVSLVDIWKDAYESHEAQSITKAGQVSST